VQHVAKREDSPVSFQFRQHCGQSPLFRYRFPEIHERMMTIIVRWITVKDKEHSRDLAMCDFDHLVNLSLDNIICHPYFTFDNEKWKTFRFWCHWL
jgi:hypothetical protein